MRRGVRPCGGAVIWGIGVGLLCLFAAVPAQASAGWTRAFRLAGPQPIDVSAPRVAIAASGTIAVAYSRYDEDAPANSQAYLAVRSSAGPSVGPLAVPGAQQVLDLAYSGSTLELLTGGAPRGQTCCSYARAVSVSGSHFGRSRTVVGGLAGFTLGRLIALGSGRLLAAVATERGVWAAQSVGDDRFAPSRLLSQPQRAPWTLAATILPSSRTFIGWTEGDLQPGDPGPTALMLAEGSVSAAPRSARAVLVVAPTHELDELTLAPGPTVPTAAWIESWFASDGSYHSEPAVADLDGRPRARTFPAATTTASDISAAGDGSGQQVVAWKACNSAASCWVWAIYRRSGGRFGSPSRLGVIDGAQAPATAVGADGHALVGWVDQGRVWAARHGRTDTRFSARAAVATSSLSHDLSLVVAPDGSILAAWTEGTLHPSVVGAYYRFG